MRVAMKNSDGTEIRSHPPFRNVVAEIFCPETGSTMARSKRTAHLKQELKRTSFWYVKDLDSENIPGLPEWQRFSSQSNPFLEDVKQNYDNHFSIGWTDLGHPCLTYDLHVRVECHTREEIWDSFEKTLATAKGIARLMKKHGIFKILLVPGKGRFVLKKELRFMFEDSTEFCLRTMKDNEGMVVLKQIKK